VILTAVPRRFNAAQAKLASTNGATLRGEHVRRPVRGIVIKDDTFSTLRVVSQDDNAPVYLVDAGSNRKLSNGGREFLEINGQRFTDVYSNFLIQSVTEERMEKAQVLETFGEPFIFLFGERARVLNISGILLNSFDFNWKAEWMENYERFLRGTKCVENDALVFLSFDETLVGGYVISTTTQTSATDKNFVQFQFQLFVTNYSSFSNVGNPKAGPNNTNINNRELTALESDVGRPNRVVPTDFFAGGDVLKEANFFDSLASGLNVVRNAWNSVQKVVNGAIRTVSGALNGEIIRVPRGFEGSMVFDEGLTPAQLQQQLRREETTIGPGGQILFTYFSDNQDEYIGASDHYGSAISAAGANRVNFEGTHPVLNDRKYVAKAREIWASYGFAAPDDSLSPLSAFLLRKGTGMISAGLTKGWKTGSVTAGLGAAANVPYVGSGAKGAVILAGRAPTALAQLKPGINPE
jgi:hypothetical protein